MNKKLLIIVVLLLAGAGGAYKLVLAKPKEAEAKPKVEGSVYVLGKEFLVNLSEGRFAKLTVALVLDPEDHSTAPAAGGHGVAPKPPEGYGPMPQEALIRAIVTDQLTDARPDALIDRRGREHLQEKILKHIDKHSDVHAEEVLFTDVTVQ
jgi:flagellar basal body-associated protein FliL